MLFNRLRSVKLVLAPLLLVLSGCGDDPQQFPVLNNDPVSIAKQLESDAKLLQEAMAGEQVGVRHVAYPANQPSNSNERILVRLLSSTTRYREMLEQDPSHFSESIDEFDRMNSDFDRVQSALSSVASVQSILQRMDSLINQLESLYGTQTTAPAWNSSLVIELATSLRESAWNAYVASRGNYYRYQHSADTPLSISLSVLVDETRHLYDEIVRSSSSKSATLEELSHVEEAYIVVINRIYSGSFFNVDNRVVISLDDLRMNLIRMKRYYYGKERRSHRHPDRRTPVRRTGWGG